MFPVSVINHPTRRLPYMTYGLIALNILVFLWQTTKSPVELTSIFYTMAVVPCELGKNLFSPESFVDIVRGMFLHASWAHLAGNMLFLWIFGSNVEDYFGRRRFLAAYVVAGVAAALLQTLFFGACVPMVGASGAVAGVLGAFLVLYPGVRVRVAAIFFRFFMKTFALPAWLVLGYWFVLQVFNGIGTLGVETLGGGVAFFAHIGGFLAGAVLAFLTVTFKPAPTQPIYSD